MQIPLAVGSSDVSSEWRFAEKRLGYQLAEVTGLDVRQDISGVRGVMHEYEPSVGSGTVMECALYEDRIPVRV